MKKVILLLIIIMSAIAAEAANYRVKYDVLNQCETSFVVRVGYDRVSISQTSYSLRRMGTITNSGITFDSYSYGNRDGMFCVSTTSISLQLNIWKTISGYIIIIDNKAYLADKID